MSWRAVQSIAGAKTSETKTMPWIIKATAELDDADIKALKALSAAVFPPRPGPPKTDIPTDWARPEWHIMLWTADKQAVSYVGALARQILFDDDQVYAGGIGGVKTHPAHRSQGHASAGIQLAIDFLRDELDVDLTLLVCRHALIPYYQRFGFVHFTGKTLATQHGVNEKFTWNETMLLAGKSPIPRCQVIDKCGPPW